MLAGLTEDGEADLKPFDHVATIEAAKAAVRKSAKPSTLDAGIPDLTAGINYRDGPKSGSFAHAKLVTLRLPRTSERPMGRPSGRLLAELKPRQERIDDALERLARA